MLARCLSTLLIASLLTHAVGCAAFPDMASMAMGFNGKEDEIMINTFCEGLAAKDVAKIKGTMTPALATHAFPHPQSMDDLALLKLPTGEVKVTKTEEVSETEKNITVEVGESKRKMMCKLTSNKRGDYWRIDEVYLSQRQNGQYVTKSVSEQMRLLTAIRDFTDTWSSGDRERILASVDPELRTALEPLPPMFMARLNKQLIGSTTSASSSRPSAEINRHNAVVTFTQPDGKLMVSMKEENEKWVVEDLQKDSRNNGQKIDSLRKRAMVINRSLAFLKNFGEADKKELAGLTTPSFYKNTIAPSNPAFVKLPNGFEPDARFEISEIDQHADFILEMPTQIVRLKLKVQTNAEDASGYYVDDATIYDMQLAQEKKLSALLTATSVVNLYHDAYHESNMALLRNLSTSELNQQVWNRMTLETFQMVPAQELREGQPEIISSDFRGRLTEVTVRQGNHELIYLLRERTDQWLVDDIQIKSGDKLESMKERLAVLTPIYEFAYAMHSNNINRVRNISSEDFRRRVWLQADSVPFIQSDIVGQITQPLVDFKTDRSGALVSLGTPQNGAQIHLTMENGVYQINDAMLPTNTGTPVAMKQAMRMQLAYGNSTSQQIATVSNEVPSNTLSPLPGMRAQQGKETANAPRPVSSGGFNGANADGSQQVFHAVYQDQEEPSLLATPLGVMPAGGHSEPKAFKRNQEPAQIQHPGARPMVASPLEALSQPVPMNYK